MSGRIRGEQIKDESVTGDDIKDDSVGRSDLNVTTPGQAVITKIIAGNRISITQTGAAEGTGDVTINVIPKYQDFAKRINGDGLINQTTINFAYIDKTFVIPRAGNYKICFDGKYSINGTGADFQAQINYQYGVVDTDIEICRREGKDAAGTGVVYPDTNGINRNTGTDQTHDVNFKDLLVNIPAGNLRVRIQFRCANFTNQEAAFHRGLLIIEEWGV